MAMTNLVIEQRSSIIVIVTVDSLGYNINTSL